MKHRGKIQPIVRPATKTTRQTLFVRDLIVPCAIGVYAHEKGKRQNQLTDKHINKIIDTYKDRKQEERYSRRVEMEKIEENGFNLNISRYVSTAQLEEQIDLKATHAELVKAEKSIKTARDKHNAFLEELGLPPLP